MANEASKFTMADGTDVSIVDSRIGDLTSTGITGYTVAAQLKELNSNHVELLAQATDAYEATWTLRRFGRTYQLTVQRSNQSVATPHNAIHCPFTPDPSWLPTYSFAVMSVSQRGNPWNVNISPSSITGWNYVEDNGQRFISLTWFK